MHRSRLLLAALLTPTLTLAAQRPIKVFISVDMEGIGGIGTLEHGKETLIEKGPRSVSPLAVPLMMGNAAAGAVAMRHGIRGQSYSILSACAAGARPSGRSARRWRCAPSWVTP